MQSAPTFGLLMVATFVGAYLPAWILFRINGSSVAQGTEAQGYAVLGQGEGDTTNPLSSNSTIQKRGGISPKTMSLLSSFSAGVLLGAVFFTILPEGLSTLLESHTVSRGADQPDGGADDDSGKVGVTLFLGFAFMYIMEAGSASWMESWTRTSGMTSTQEVIASSHSTLARGDSAKSGSGLSASTVSWFGLLIHSLCDGIALGAAAAISPISTQDLPHGADSLTWIIWFALMLHKVPTSFALATFMLSEAVQTNNQGIAPASSRTTNITEGVSDFVSPQYPSPLNSQRILNGEEECDCETMVYHARLHNMHKPTRWARLNAQCRHLFPMSSVKLKMCIFALACPIGSMLTVLLVAVINACQHGGKLHGAFTAWLLIFSAGTFLYVATMHVLPESKEMANTEDNSREHHDGMEHPTIQAVTEQSSSARTVTTPHPASASSLFRPLQPSTSDTIHTDESAKHRPFLNLKQANVTNRNISVIPKSAVPYADSMSSTGSDDLAGKRMESADTFRDIQAGHTGFDTIEHASSGRSRPSSAAGANASQYHTRERYHKAPTAKYIVCLAAGCAVSYVASLLHDD